MIASRLRLGDVSCVIVGADRIAANGDFANKIGTYGLALAARAHEIPFYVAAPSSTIDLNTPNGVRIPIEQRDSAGCSAGARSGPLQPTQLPGIRRSTSPRLTWSLRSSPTGAS
jgi:methylthioribose-1-phosphate isomerase